MAKEIIYISPDAVKPHPRNSEFFDNANGEDYVRLMQSIAELGILTPLKVAADMTIVSGHQRYRAAKELGMKQIPVLIDDELSDEDDKLQQLIAANFGRMKNDPVKQGKLLKEYERLRGVTQGRQKNGNNFRISQEEIARELGVDARSVRNLKQLTTLIPELQEVISTGQINATTGFKLLARLSDDEQRELVARLPATGKLTQAKVQQYVDQLRAKDDEIAQREDEIAALTAEKEAAEQAKADAERTAREALEAVNEHEAMMDGDSVQRRLDELETDRRNYYEKYTKAKEELEREKQARRRVANELEDLLHPPIGAESPVKTVYPADYAQLQEKARQYEELLNQQAQTTTTQDDGFANDCISRAQYFLAGIKKLRADPIRTDSFGDDRLAEYTATLEQIFNNVSDILAMLRGDEAA